MMVLLADTFTRRPRMAGTIDAALARLRPGGLEHFVDSTAFEQHCRDCGHVWRRRVLGPAVTLQLLLLQVLHGNVAINALRQLSGISFAAASYCQARARLPLAAVHQALQPGDSLVGDRAFCSYAQIALLMMRGVHCCFRMQQRRRVDAAGVVRWSKPYAAAPWMSRRQFDTLAHELSVRIVRYQV